MIFVIFTCLTYLLLNVFRLNHNSSRSHCIFTIKMVRIADKDRPHMARVSMLSFCDLAGSERIKKTMNTGERQKEAGNINTSLLVLGRCIKAIRHNQMIKDARKHQIIPYRDSKLTRLFQSYFTGSGKVSMIVNISQSSYLFDEVIYYNCEEIQYVMHSLVRRIFLLSFLKLILKI